MHSETIGKIAAALAKAQGEMAAAKKDRENKFTKSKYATLASVQDAIRKSLSDNELSYFQATELENGSEVLFTMLVHSSGEWYKTENVIPNIIPHKMLSPVQSYGILLTYLKRYQLSALVGVSVADEDNDGNQEQPQQEQPEQQPQHKYTQVDSVLSMLYFLDQDIEFNPTEPYTDYSLAGLLTREMGGIPQTKKQWQAAYQIAKFRKSPEGEYCHSVMKSSSFYKSITQVSDTIKILGMKIVLDDPDALGSLMSALNDYALQQKAKDV